MTDAELFDVSDITFDFVPRKGKNELLLIMKAERSICLMRFYLALRSYLEQMEQEIGVMAESEFEQ